VSYGFGVTGGYKIEGVKSINVEDDAKDLIRQAQVGLNKYAPAKTDALDCTGGVYFMKGNTGSMVGVFKPQDEEQGMMNNPKGHAGNGSHGLRPHFKPGDGYLREYASYLLDYENFCKIPTTTIASCEHPTFNYFSTKEKETYPKIGSLQQYIRANDTYDDISPSLLSAFEVQKIALLDMRLLNCDRNGANILAVRKELPHPSERRNSRGESLSSVGELNETELDVLDFIAGSSHFKESSRPLDTYELIPIDHGYSLPTHLQIDEFDWVWLYAKQVAQPVDPRIKAYLRRLNFDELITKVTAQVALPEDTIFLLRVVHDFIVQSVEAGLTLHDIACQIVRFEDGVPSPLEKLIARAEESALSAIEVREGHHFSKIVAVSESNSPVRRGKSPATILASTPPRVSELLQMKRMVKSEMFQDASTDDGEYRHSLFNSDDIKEDAANKVGADEDYFMKDIAGGQSPVPPVEMHRAGNSLLSPTFVMQGEELKTMKTLDSSGLTLFFNSQRKLAAEKEIAPLKMSMPSQPSPVSRTETFGDYYEGLTTSEASSYESTGPSPRSYLDTNFLTTNRVPTFGSPVSVPQTMGTGTPSLFTRTMPAKASAATKDGEMDRKQSFEALEVRTFQPLVFDKPSRTRASSNTIEDGYDSTSELDRDSSASSTPSERMFEQMNLNGKSKFGQKSTKFSHQPNLSTDSLQALPMARVSSFNALESPPLYTATGMEVNTKPHRLMRNLRREKRKHLGKSAEFLALRQQFVHHFMKKLIVSSRLRSGSL